MKTDLSQTDAVRHREGPAMILAGPGSGKTTVITHRVMQMVSDPDIDPASILVITFSRAAAREMRERFLILSGRRRYPVTFGTFHAIFFQFLKNAYGYSAKQIVSGAEQTRFVREYIRRLRLETTDEEELVRSILTAVGRRKNSPGDPYVSLPPEPEIFEGIFDAYGEFLRMNRRIDFDDMLILTKELLEGREDILNGWRDRFRYILIDEFQDINRIQYDIVRMLAFPRNNLFIVGDDDQSIYRFRGADPSIMLRFERDYPEAKRITLSTNYRSTPQIVHAAGNLIAHNRSRFLKDIRAEAASGSDPVIERFQTQSAQNAYVISSIEHIERDLGVPFSEIAVLFRTNAQPSLLMRQLAARNIPFYSKEHSPSLYDHWIAKDIRTYLLLAGGDRSRSSFIRIMNRPERDLSRESLPCDKVSFDAWEQYYRCEGQYFRSEEQYLRSEGRMIKNIRKLESDLALLSGMRPYAAVNYIRRAAGYDDYLKECSAAERIPLEELTEIMEEIQEDARGFETCEAWLAHQEMVLREWEKRSEEKKEPGSAVVLSTFHAAKGLEFDTVFLIDVDEGVIPDKKAVTPEAMEEERRLFYVGMTRAKRRLYILCSEKIKNKEKAPSRFLDECLDDTYPQS